MNPVFRTVRIPLSPGVIIWRPLCNGTVQNVIPYKTNKGSYMYRVWVPGPQMLEPVFADWFAKGLAAFAPREPIPSWTHAVVTRCSDSAVHLLFDEGPLDYYAEWLKAYHMRIDAGRYPETVEGLRDFARETSPPEPCFNTLKLGLRRCMISPNRVHTTLLAWPNSNSA